MRKTMLCFFTLFTACGDFEDQSNLEASNTRYTFPFDGPALYDYATGGRAFGACRDNCTRKHAGSDLIHNIGHPIFAIASGTIVDYHYFYAGTYALVIKHPDYVIRYGEVDAKIAKGLKIGSKVSRGQLIARVGDLEGMSSSMLHFEMFSGQASGPLTTRQAPFYRRWDLLDPTRPLKAWPYP